MRYFIYNATSDIETWNSQLNVIDTSFVDTIVNYYDIDSSYQEYWGISIASPLIDGIVNWIASLVSQETLSCEVESWIVIVIFMKMQSLIV